MVFVPKRMRTHRQTTHAYCQWCAKRGARKHLYKLRDGPVDWWFCDDDHALEWLDARHRNCNTNAYLRKTPMERQQFLDTDK